MNTIARPAWRWIGNKHDLLNQLRPLRPRSFRRYFEPFAGSLAMFWDIARTFDGPCFLSDANADLVLVYRVIRDDVNGIVDALSRLTEAPATQDIYLGRRAAYNERNLVEVDRAAHFIYLVQTCFNGLYRVGPRGFNAWWGKRDHSLVLNEELLRACSEVLKRAGISVQTLDWRDAVAEADCGDYVYLDCPYVPSSSNERHTEYTRGGFTIQNQRELAAAFRALVRSGVQCMLSNSDTPLVRDLYAGFDITEVTRSGRMKQTADRSERVTELVICGGYTT